MRETVQPIFVLSLPRSGSTLLQRVLSTYPQIATSAEPWLLLPLLSPLEAGIPVTTGWQRSVDEAFRAFVTELPRGEDDYLEALRPLVRQLYARAAGEGSRYFLDKTPPYHWIAERIFRLFPDAKFIFLWRHPLSVVSSVIETFAGGRWRPDDFRGTLFDGPRNLVAAYEAHAGQALAVRYEDLVGGEPEAWQRLAEYLDLDFVPDSLSGFTDVRFEGRHGDPVGVHRYSRVSREPVEKWRQTLRSPVRRFWCERYLAWLGESRLATMGYDLDAMLGDLDRLPSDRRRGAADLGDAGRGLIREALAGAVSGGRGTSSWALLRPGRFPAPPG
jgi:Sulfotransferase family